MGLQLEVHTLKGTMTLTDYKSLFIYTHLYLQALIKVPSVTIQWNPVDSGRMDAFLQESVGHQKVQPFCHNPVVSRLILLDSSSIPLWEQIPVESGGMDAFLQESVGHQKYRHIYLIFGPWIIKNGQELVEI